MRAIADMPFHFLRLATRRYGNAGSLQYAGYIRLL
jgi:hypothetical protein